MTYDGIESNQFFFRFQLRYSFNDVTHSRVYKIVMFKFQSRINNLLLIDTYINL